MDNTSFLVKAGHLTSFVVKAGQLTFVVKAGHLTSFLVKAGQLTSFLVKADMYRNLTSQQNSKYRCRCAVYLVCKCVWESCNKGDILIYAYQVSCSDMTAFLTETPGIKCKGNNMTTGKQGVGGEDSVLII